MGKGPHEGRDHNLGPNVRVVVDPEKLRQIKRLMAQSKAQTGRRLTFSSAIRRLVDIGMAVEATRPIGPIAKVGKRTTVRFEAAAAERLRSIAASEARDMTVVIDGFLALALREQELKLAS
ncbi:MAG: hypothetical protein C4558_06340 [Dehalococcoidia bacterium]|nr:MAG: hypothetical protein C4558_06340 [Dehalococcoidia bacterium]